MRSKILLLARSCPEYELCKLLSRLCTIWSPRPLRLTPRCSHSKWLSLSLACRYRSPDVCCWLCLEWPLPPSKLLWFFKTNIVSFLKSSLTFKCKVNYSLPQPPPTMVHTCFLPFFKTSSLCWLNLPFYIGFLHWAVLASRGWGPFLINHCAWGAWYWTW